MIGIKTLVVEHNGKERIVELRWDVHAIYKLQERRPDIHSPLAYWCSFGGVEEVPEEVTPKDLLRLTAKIPPDRDLIDWIWAGLLWKNKGATIDHAIQIYSEFPGSMVMKAQSVANEILPAIFEALGVKISVEPSEKESGPDPTRTGPTSESPGTGSGGSDGSDSPTGGSGSPASSTSGALSASSR